MLPEGSKVEGNPTRVLCAHVGSKPYQQGAVELLSCCTVPRCCTPSSIKRGNRHPLSCRASIEACSCLSNL